MNHAARPVRRRKHAESAPDAIQPAPHRPDLPLPPMPLPADPLLAAAALLPRLDREAEAGHAASRDAAALLRRFLAPAPAPAPPGTQPLADAVHRLLALVRQQDRQLAQLHAMLDVLL